MMSLLAKTCLTLALFGALFQTAVTEDGNSRSSLSVEDGGLWRNKRAVLTMTCENYASCSNDTDNYHTCFCDRLCRVYGDCCPDYVDKEGGHQLTPLSPRSFVCRKFPDHSRQPVYVITECPATYSVQFVLDGCRQGSESTDRSSADIIYLVPVSNRVTGLVYRNIYCAMCHDEEDVSFWNVTSEHCDMQVQENQGSETTESAGVDDMEHESFVSACLFSFSPMRDVPVPRRCIDNIATCPDEADAELASQCSRPSRVAYVYQPPTGQAYRSRDCAACNGISDHDLQCTSMPLDDREPPVESFDVIFDLNTMLGSKVRTGSGGPLIQRLGSCPERHVYDPFAGVCRGINCPPGRLMTASDRCQLVIASDTRPSFRSPIMIPTDNPDCSWIRLGSSEYQLLFNKSIYVPVHDATYDTDSYHLDDNDTAYVCTSFQRNYTEWIDEALRVDAVGAYMSTVCSAVSLLALSFQFTVYMLFPVLRNTPGRCIICLVVSLFVGQLLFVLVKTGRSVSSWFCFVQAATMHYAFMAAFFWMSVIAFDVQRTFGASPGATAASSSPSAARRRFVGYSVYAWLSALAVVGVGVAMDLSEVGGAYRPYYGHRICWFGSRGGLLVLFGVPVGVLLTANIVMFVLSVRHIRTASIASKMAVQKTDQMPLLVS